MTIVRDSVIEYDKLDIFSYQFTYSKSFSSYNLNFSISPNILLIFFT